MAPVPRIITPFRPRGIGTLQPNNPEKPQYELCPVAQRGARIQIIVSYSIAIEGFDQLAPSWHKLILDCPGSSVFLTPQWHQTWWRHFGSGELLLLAVRNEGELSGVAPLMKVEGGLSLLGSSDVCDYLDFISRPQDAEGVCRAVFDWVRPQPWDNLDLFSLPARSVIRRHFIPLAAANNLTVREEPEDVSLLMDLPGTWEDYLSGLARSDRHELRRKMRRLAGEPGVAREIVSDTEHFDRDMEDFFRLFLDSREAKSRFLTAQRADFFKDMVRVMADNGWLKLFFLTISGVRVATAIIFDYGDTFYLYNSGYDQRYAHLGVGLLLKAQCIQEGIDRGKRRFDFLRGKEPYKYQLGGRDQTVYRCRISRS